MTPPRRIPVLVGTLPIEDGQTPPPAVGQPGHYPLIFAEAVGDGPDATAATFAVRAEPLGDGRPVGPGLRWDGVPHDGPPTWPTVLRGDGWSAAWRAPRPVTGPLRLHGTLVGDLGISSRQWVRGLVVRAWVVSETYDTSGPDEAEWPRIPAAQHLREVTEAPHRFDNGRIARRDAATGRLRLVPRDPFSPEVGVLVELELG